MLTMHPRFGAMYPTRARAVRGFGAGEELIQTVQQGVAAFQRAVQTKKAQGYVLGLTELFGIGAQIVSQAKSQGMSFTSAATLLATLYDMARDWVAQEPAASEPTPTPPAKPPDAPMSGGAIAAIAGGGALLLWAATR